MVKKIETSNHLVTHHSHHLFSGPLPPPEILAKYENLQTGLAERIIRMAEEQASHRQTLETKSLEAKIHHFKKRNAKAKLGQIYAFIVAMAAILGGLTLAYFDKQIVAAIISGLGLGGIITAFIYGRTNQI